MKQETKDKIKATAKELAAPITFGLVFTGAGLLMYNRYLKNCEANYVSALSGQNELLANALDQTVTSVSRALQQ